MSNISTKGKQKRKAPPLIVMILFFILAASILTYIIPAGAFDIDPNTKQNIAGTYHHIENTPVSPFRALGMIYDGMNTVGKTINLLLFLGGVIGLFLSLGATEEVLNWTMYKLKDRGSNYVIIICCFMMSFIGAFAANNALVSFTALGLLVSKKLRMDPLVGMGIFFYSTFIGFCTGPTGAYIAQGIANVPMYSGFAVRTVWWLVSTAVVTMYIIWYGNRIRKDPNKSFMGNTEWLDDIDQEEIEKVDLNTSSVITMLLLFGGFMFMAYAISKLKWSQSLAFCTMAMLAIIAAFIRGRNIDDIIIEFSNGLKSMAFICFAIGAAATIGLVLQAGNILPTVVNAITVPLSMVSKGVSAIIMFILNAIINIIIPSRGGQAAIVIPIMAPIGDMLGITRQVVVTAFNLGDGITNMINPLDGATFGALSLSGVALYGKWFKWAAPLTGILIILSSIMLYVVAVVGWTGL